ncbi:hypothetical protein D1872_316820 [compost metagenome]
MYKVDAKFSAAWCAAMVTVSNRLMSNVTAAKIEVSKKVANPIGMPIRSNSFHLLSDTPHHLRKTPYRANG